jgi:hypothetical protein
MSVGERRKFAAGWINGCALSRLNARKMQEEVSEFFFLAR